MQDKHGHRRRRTFTKLPGNMADRRKSFISGLLRASDARYMKTALYQSWSLHFKEMNEIGEPLFFGDLHKQFFLVGYAVAVPLQIIVPRDALVEERRGFPCFSADRLFYKSSLPTAKQAVFTR